MIDSAIEYNAARPYQPPHWAAIQTTAGTTPDGIPGRLTAEAVARWQADQGLDVDGKVGPATLAAIKLEYVLGLDVSHHEGIINWDAVARDPAGYRYVWIKATQDTDFTDPRLRENAHGAADAGFMVGYYHFADTVGDIGRGDVHAQIDHFLDAIDGLPSAGLPLVLDIEGETPLSPSNYTSWCETWLAAIRGYTRGYGALMEPVVYTSKRIVERDLASDHQLGRYPLWSPRYSGSFTTPPDLAPGWSHWDVWQFTAKGQVQGIESNVDINRACPVWFGGL